MKINKIYMKMFMLISMPLILFGVLHYTAEKGPEGKSSPPQEQYSGDMSLSDTWSANSSTGALFLQQSVSEPETNDDNRLLFKNIIVCIP
jgi:hypothetical protein